MIIYLDIQKAYDSVDWNVLIKRLGEEYSLPNELSWMIIELFTGVKSTIAINGVESTELIHRAGVLQGSVISPILYSSYINSMAGKIRQILRSIRPGEEDDLQCTFMYADDVAILVRSDAEMEAVLRGCEEHSREIHYKFNVRKCEIMNSSLEHVIYGESVTPCQDFKYLGIMMDKEGINWDKHIKRMSEKTDKILNFFRSIGYNSYGFRERTRLQLYKTFLRPLFEYGLCMMPPIKKWFLKLDKLQTKCLNGLFSTYSNTSKAALETITHLPDMSHRWKELSFRWKIRLLKRSSRHMATIARENSRRLLKLKSCFAMVNLHPFDESWGIWIREDPRNERNIKEFIIRRRREYLEGRKLQTLHLKEFAISNDCKPRQLYQLSKLNRKVARVNVLWMLGKITGKPRTCLECDKVQASYKHFMRCAEVEDINSRIRDGSWKSLYKDIMKIVNIAEGFEYLTNRQLDAG
jgi:hypothetical protein